MSLAAGLTGSLEDLGNIDKWTKTADDCLDIGDIDLGGESDEEEGEGGGEQFSIFSFSTPPAIFYKRRPKKRQK